MRALETYVQSLFLGAPDTADNRQRQQDLLAKLQIQVNEWMEAGVDESTAIDRAIASIDDPESFLKEIRGTRRRVNVRKMQMVFAWFLAGLGFAMVLLCFAILSILAGSVNITALIVMLVSIVGFAVWPVIATVLYKKQGDRIEWAEFDFWPEFKLALLIWGIGAGAALLVNVIMMLIGFDQGFWSVTVLLALGAYPISVWVYGKLFYLGKLPKPASADRARHGTPGRRRK